MTSALMCCKPVSLRRSLFVTRPRFSTADQVARGYIRKHGSVTWSDIAASFDAAPPCPLLQTYWHFDGCRYDKGSFSCSEPDHIDTCPVPRHRLRNGRLNQTVYSIFLFVRDVAKGDLVGWIDAV